MKFVENDANQLDSQPVHATICIDSEALDRLSSVIRHLVVGLIDESIHVRLVSSDERIKSLQLGPIQTVVHPLLAWPFARKRYEDLVATLSAQPPTTVHALTAASYELAAHLADVFDADFVAQITSEVDVGCMSTWTGFPVQRFLVFTDPLADELREHAHVGDPSIRVVHPGVQVAKQVASFGYPERVATLLCSSNLDRDSGIDLLIDAAASLNQAHPELMVFILGEGKRENHVRDMIRQRKLSSTVTIVNPIGDHTLAMGSADIYVRPFRSTAIRADLLEAMGAGMAIVSVDSPVADHLHHDRTAVICDDTGESLTQAVDALLTDRERARRIATTGMEYIREHHSMSTMAQLTAKAYRELKLARSTLSLPE